MECFLAFSYKDNRQRISGIRDFGCGPVNVIFPKPTVLKFTPFAFNHRDHQQKEMQICHASQPTRRMKHCWNEIGKTDQNWISYDIFPLQIQFRTKIHFTILGLETSSDPHRWNKGYFRWRNNFFPP